MEIEKVKAYLRVDYDEDDELIKMIMDAAKEYVTGAVGYMDETNPKAQILYLAVIEDMYDNRKFTVTEQQKRKTAYMFASIIMQLKYEGQEDV